jgi:hypothetical protein
MNHVFFTASTQILPLLYLSMFCQSANQFFTFKKTEFQNARDSDNARKDAELHSRVFLSAYVSACVACMHVCLSVLFCFVLCSVAFIFDLLLYSSQPSWNDLELHFYAENTKINTSRGWGKIYAFLTLTQQVSSFYNTNTLDTNKMC